MRLTPQEALRSWPSDRGSAEAFVARILDKGRELYRDLPWRNADDPYAVLVSEIMLQQTQVARVARYWERFLKAFPTLDALAASSVSDVLELWQGLGYNRRALALKRTADQCAVQHGGALPPTMAELLELPGIGPATAAGVMAFAYQKPAPYLETNVRAVFLHELFPDRDKVSDSVLFPYVEAASMLSQAALQPRAWNYALLDYGAHLKATTVNPSRRSSSYARQSTFEGSRRQKRANILRLVLANPGGVASVDVFADLNEIEEKAHRPAIEYELFADIVADLVSEGFIMEQAETGILFVAE